MDRRDFIKLGVIGGAVVVSNPDTLNNTLYAHDGRLFQSYNRVKLVDENSNAIKASKLVKEEAYIFNYPHVGTPNFLINLGKPAKRKVILKTQTGKEYLWSEGVGTFGAIVAYSGICSHQLMHPNKEISVVSYVKNAEKTMACDRGGMIICAAHLSAFDPEEGGKNYAGPANEGLASIVLEHDEKTDELYAVGVLGPQRYQEYFASFKKQLKKDFGGKRKAKKLVKISAPVTTLSKYTKEVLKT